MKAVLLVAMLLFSGCQYRAWALPNGTGCLLIPEQTGWQPADYFVCIERADPQTNGGKL